MHRTARPVFAALALSAVAGCHRDSEPVPYADITIKTEHAATVSGPNAFDRYANLADRAANLSTVPLDARDTLGTRTRSLSQLSGTLDDLMSATHLPCSFRFEPSGPFDARPHQEGWLLLGRAIVWKIESCVEAGEWDAAARWTVAGVTFGLDLSGGSVSDASLGYGVADGARRAMAPYVATMPAEALNELADGLEAALARCPDSAVTIQNESQLMLAAVQELQQAHKDGKLTELATKFYGDSRSAVLGLAKLDGPERSAFFQALLDEQARSVSGLLSRSQTPGAKRGKLESGVSGDALTIARQFFSAGEPWLSSRDLTIARTRLLYLDAKISQSRAETGAVPGDLLAFPIDNRTDPYTGLPFGYLALGQDFIVYSYGADGKDDRGDSNASRTEPDLLIEDVGS